MDAAPLLIRVTKLLQRYRLDAVLVCNAGTSGNLRFQFHKTRPNLKKLKSLASSLDAIIFRSYYPNSGLYRIAREDGLQLDFITAADGIESSVRAKTICFADAEVAVPTQADTNEIEKAPGRDPDYAVLDGSNKRKRVTRKATLDALKKETDLALRDQIRRLMALPPERRCNFLRKRIAFRISCL